jgi:hypothetical protein
VADSTARRRRGIDGAASASRAAPTRTAAWAARPRRPRRPSREQRDIGRFQIVAQLLTAPQQRLAVGRHARQHRLDKVAAQAIFGRLDGLLLGQLERQHGGAALGRQLIPIVLGLADQRQKAHAIAGPAQRLNPDGAAQVHDWASGGWA